MIQTTVTTSRFGTTAQEYIAPVPTADRATLHARTPWWGALLAGAISAIALQAIFAVLGMAIGLTIIGTANDDTEQALSIGAGIYWLITGLVSLFFGGWVAGWLAPTRDRMSGALHGFLAWCAVTVFSIWIISMAGGAAAIGSMGIMNPIITDTAGEGSVAVSANGETNVLTEAEVDEAAERAAVAAWWTVIALVLGAGVASAAGIGGVVCGEAHVNKRYATANTPVARSYE